jgi:peptide-methionine (R)-S-oxide reductase
MLPLAAALALAACSSGDDKKPVMQTNAELPADASGKVMLSDDQWRERLTPDQFHILREAGTERPNGEVYREFKQQGAGAYHCGGCGALLFSSQEKFDSGCGWPSFYDPAKAENVVTREDRSLGMKRIEVLCARCDGHLGHVFEGEGFATPTDKRYCINGTALRFVPKGE